MSSIIHHHHHHHHHHQSSSSIIIINHHHHHHFHVTSVFSYLGWGWMGKDCFPHALVLHHMLLHSQQVHIPHHSLHFPLPTSHLPQTLTSPTSLSTPTPLSLSHVQTISVSLPQLNKKVFNFTHLTARPPVLPPHSCHVSWHPAITSA